MLRAGGAIMGQGEFKLDKFEGQGRYDWADGASYSGQWRENK
jgi:hypothetical protein